MSDKTHTDGRTDRQLADLVLVGCKQPLRDTNPAYFYILHFRVTNMATDLRQEYFADQQAEMAQCSTWEDMLILCQNMDLSSHPLPQTLYPDELQSRATHQISKNLIKQITDLQPGLNPICAYGDGNCLYRSISLIFFGNEDSHIEMRVRTIKELAVNSQYYTSGDFVDQLEYSANDTFKYIMNVSLNLSGEFTIEDYKSEICSNAKLGTFASFLHLLATANWTGRPLLSIYPKVSNPGLNRRTMNQLIYPLGNLYCPEESKDVLMIMWTRTVQMSTQGWSPNHFVPVIQEPPDTTRRFVSNFPHQKIFYPENCSDAIMIMHTCMKSFKGVGE